MYRTQIESSDSAYSDGSNSDSTTTSVEYNEEIGSSSSSSEEESSRIPSRKVRPAIRPHRQPCRSCQKKTLQKPSAMGEDCPSCYARERYGVEPSGLHPEQVKYRQKQKEEAYLHKEGHSFHKQT